jgi:hypothetical protein
MPGAATRQRAFLALVVTASALVVGANASATTSRVTRGDAQAVFQAANTGGAAIRLHSGQIVGPARGAAEDGVRINAFAPWDGRHYCSLDWHVISINLNDGNFPGESRSRQEIAAALDTVHVAFALDGVDLELERTAVKRSVDAAALGLVEGFYFASGRVLAPEELTVGQHTLRIVVTDPSGLVADSQITFFVDAAGTGACI